MEHAIRDLVKQSYTNGLLDDKKVDQISAKLPRRILKDYIRYLKEYESKLHVYVYSAKAIEKKQKDMVSKLFSHKTIVYRLDSDIISGIKIVDYDMVYEISLRQIFNDIGNYLINYD